MGDERARCAACGVVYPRRDGIWRLLDATASGRQQPLINAYRKVRDAEGWGGDGADCYRALPFADLTGRRPELWRIRAASFRTLLRRVVVRLERRHRRSLLILDLGAGNGWLSGRLAARGHNVAAVDLLDDVRDGLGAYRAYPTVFTPVQADFDRLPLSTGEADLVVFNASLHYAADAGETLAEARRVLRPDGVIAVVDTPFYRDRGAGVAMVHERGVRFARDFGIDVRKLEVEGFFTLPRLTELAQRLGLRLTAWRNPTWWRMRARAILAVWRGGRETATFPVVGFSPADAGRGRLP